jgi:PAS domain S-box-containing protein
MTKRMDDISGETIARYQQLFEESQEAIIILTRESQVVDVNRAWLDLFGYEREEIIGTDAGRASTQEDLQRLQGHMDGAGSVKNYGLRLSRKNGRQIDCLVTAAVLRDENGLHGYIYRVHDVTAQKETERSLRSLLHLSDKLNSASDVDGVLDRLVEELLELIGAESGCAGLRTIQGMSCGHFFQGHSVVPLTYHCVPGVGWAGWLIEHGTHYLTNDAAHDPVILSEVRERLAITSGIAIPIVDSEKDVIAFFEVYNKRGGGGFSPADVDRSLAAAQIASLAIHNRLLYRNLSALAAFSQSLNSGSDFDELLEVVGRHIELNFKRRSVILLPFNGGLTPRFRSADFVLGESELAAAAWSWEHGQDAGRSTDILSAAKALYLPLKARGEVIGVLGLEVKPKAWFSNVQHELLGAFISHSAFAIERGLLEQKIRRLRFLEESTKVQNAVLSAISHDVRTPLAAITASLSGLLSSDGALNQVAERQLLETADLEARRLNRLVNNLLSMTRLETGVSTVQTEPHDLLDVVSAALEEMGPSARHRQVFFDIPEDLPLVPMDFGLITHVFINLFSNAFKYSPPDQPVEVRGRILNDQLEVLVVDRGVGVPPEDLGRVFDKFYRVAELRPSTGLGLGLAICKAFIEAHDGRIRLERNPMGGTIVRFVIPFRGTGTRSGKLEAL